ncbi:MAG: hypothetical protein Q4D02_06685 [Clostridia bacterium]|nr:hypothetical protein [Clostridia bacterium]
MESNNIKLEDLLIHWWHYYGSMIYTLQELEDFRKLIAEKGEEKILEVAVASFICDDGKNTMLLICMRENRVDELLATLPKIEEMSKEAREQYYKIKEEFLRQITHTYFHGED